MLKKILVVVFSVVFFGLIGCSKKQSKESSNTIKVGTIAGPETQLMEIAKDVALDRYGLKIQIVAFSDYDMPNEALSDGSIDANAFQHLPYLQAQIKSHGYKFTPIAKTFLYPMAVYSNKIKKLSELKSGDRVAIPNDPSNEARALLLLQQAHLLTLKPGANVNATPLDIQNNPKQLKWVELDAAELPRALSDVALAVINTNFAIPAHLSPSKDALLVEKTDSPYVNLIVVREQDKENPKLMNLVKAFQSPPVKEDAKKLFGEGAVPGW